MRADGKALKKLLLSKDESVKNFVYEAQKQPLLHIHKGILPAIDLTADDLFSPVDDGYQDIVWCPLKSFVLLSSPKLSDEEWNEPDTHFVTQEDYDNACNPHSFSLVEFDEGLLDIYFIISHPSNKFHVIVNIQVNYEEVDNNYIIDRKTISIGTNYKDYENDEGLKYTINDQYLLIITTIKKVFNAVAVSDRYPVRVKKNTKKSQQWRRDKPDKRTDLEFVIFLNHLPEPQDNTEGTGTGGEKRSHQRRGHKRTLKADRFKNHPVYLKKDAVYVKPSWIGDKSCAFNGQTYTILCDD